MKRRWWLVVLLLLLPAILLARTWVVLQDGSGDFTDIQSAVNAASVGDSILIGPGRYDTFHYFEPSPSVTDWRVVVGVQTDSLTFIGMDRDAVIIGPTEPYPASVGRVLSTRHSLSRSISCAEREGVDGGKRIYSYGIASGTQVTWMVVENLSFEYSDNGVSVYPAGEVRSCVFRYMHDTGIVGDKAYDLVVEDCVMTRSRGGIDIYAYGGGQRSVRISRCRGDTVFVFVYNQGHPDVTVEDCNVYGNILDVWGGHALLENCHAEGGEYALSVGLSGSAEIIDCDLTVGKGVYN